MYTLQASEGVQKVEWIDPSRSSIVMQEIKRSVPASLFMHPASTIIRCIRFLGQSSMEDPHSKHLLNMRSFLTLYLARSLKIRMLTVSV